MASRHSPILLLALGLATPAAAQTPPASSGDARGAAVCAAQADRNGLTGAGRDTFLRECLAGETLDRPKADPSKP
ncbi:hypothetical protein ASF49_05155 [Methylobacterium sp. Leaf104]|uniref:hypothetical protein n=1 Tax=Methylobacterium TaxID=407 RepID=UPI0006F6EB0C|nr:MULTISPECIES: hypothetical protein [Methylobacterium]KQP38390.1 hypothetical protein ASF49_05155 [Methylobacterium sp. Leaf104]MCI9880204.1 hypothetical protein [Methylobacterium goesingense]